MKSQCGDREWYCLINFKTMEKKNLKEQNTEIKIGEFGPIYRQFEKKPKEAIKHLRKMKTGECPKALYRDDIGFIDIVWGKVTDPAKHKGYGLAHIIDKHENEIKELGFKLEDFIPIIVQFGSIKESDTKEEFLFESNYYRIVVEKKYRGKEKQWILTAFDLRRKPRK